MRYCLKSGLIRRKGLRANTIDIKDYRTWPPKLDKVWLFEKGKKPWLYEGVCSSMMWEEMQDLHGSGWVPYIERDDEWRAEDWEMEDCEEGGLTYE